MMKSHLIHMSYNKSTKKMHTESDSYNEIKKYSFLKFIVLESTRNTPLRNFLPFLIEKFISSNITPKNVTKAKDGTLLVEVKNKKKNKKKLQIYY